MIPADSSATSYTDAQTSDSDHPLLGLPFLPRDAPADSSAATHTNAPTPDYDHRVLDLPFLPRDAVDEVLKCLPCQHVARLMRVNKDFQALCFEAKHWQHHALQLTGHTHEIPTYVVKALVQGPAAERLVSSLHKQNPRPLLQDLSIADVELQPEDVRCFASQFPSLRTLTVAAKVASVGLIEHMPVTLTKLVAPDIGRRDELPQRAVEQLARMHLVHLSVHSVSVNCLQSLTKLQFLRVQGAVEQDDREGLLPLLKLTDLHTLQMTHQRGGLDDAFLQKLSVLSHLTDLDLSFNNMQNGRVRYLADLTQLSALRLSNALDREGFSILQLQLHTNLRTLHVSCCGMHDGVAESLSRLTNLTDLDIGGNPLTAMGAQHLTTLTRLQLLDITGNFDLAEGGLQWLTRLPNLHTLKAALCRLYDYDAENLAKLTSLTELEVACNPLGATGLQHLDKLSQLRRLNVCNITYAGVGARVCLSGLASLEQLDFSENVLASEGLHPLTVLSKLTSLHVNSCELTAEGLLPLSGLTGLKSLSISGNVCVKSAGIRVLTALTSLTALDASQCNVSFLESEGLVAMFKSLSKHKVKL